MIASFSIFHTVLYTSHSKHQDLCRVVHSTPKTYARRRPLFWRLLVKMSQHDVDPSRQSLCLPRGSRRFDPLTSLPLPPSLTVQPSHTACQIKEKSRAVGFPQVEFYSFIPGFSRENVPPSRNDSPRMTPQPLLVRVTPPGVYEDRVV